MSMTDYRAVFLGRRILTSPGLVGRVTKVHSPDHGGFGHWYLVVELCHGGLCFEPVGEPSGIRIVEEPREQPALFGEVGL